MVSDDEIVKVHVHTNDPGLAIQKALTYGSLSNMKIDNMRLEHQEKLIKDAEKVAAEEVKGEEVPQPEKEVGFTLISNTFYIYLDELQGILEKFFSLNKGQKEEYFGKVEKLSELIEDHISSLVKRIEKLEVEDLDINIDVLLSELERKVEDEDA